MWLCALCGTSLANRRRHPVAEFEDPRREVPVRGEGLDEKFESPGERRKSNKTIRLISSRYFEILEMPRAVVDLSEHANRVVNVVKARDGLRGKSEALEAIVAAYEESILDPALRPDFVADLERVRKGEFRRVASTDELLRRTK